MHNNSLFSEKKSNENEIVQLEQLKKHCYQTARAEVEKFFKNNLESIKQEVIAKGLSDSEASKVLQQALQEVINEADKIAQQNYEKLIKEKQIAQPPIA